MHKKKDAELKRRKVQAIKRLKQELNIIEESPEKRLWFAVLERAILDIGLRDPTRPYYKHHWNSDRFFYKIENIVRLCDMLETKLDIVMPILRKAGVWPISTDHYTV